MCACVCVCFRGGVGGGGWRKYQYHFAIHGNLIWISNYKKLN